MLSRGDRELNFVVNYKARLGLFNYSESACGRFSSFARFILNGRARTRLPSLEREEKFLLWF